MYCSAVTHVLQCCHTCIAVLAHMYCSAGTHVLQCCHACIAVLSHMYCSAVTHVLQCCYTCIAVLLHMYCSAVTHIQACSAVLSLVGVLACRLMQYSKCSSRCRPAGAGEDLRGSVGSEIDHRSGCSHMQKSTKRTSRISCALNLTIPTGHAVGGWVTGGWVTGVLATGVLLAGSAAPRGGDSDARFVVDHANLSDLLGRWMGR
jgi:hypothetical protein